MNIRDPQVFFFFIMPPVVVLHRLHLTQTFVKRSRTLAGTTHVLCFLHHKGLAIMEAIDLWEDPQLPHAAVYGSRPVPR